MEKNIVSVKVEIPLGGTIKYEWHNDRLICDRRLHTPFSYPFNYGYIENTLSEDGDEMDAVILTDYTLFPTSYIECKIIGALLTEDEKGKDEKVLLVPIFRVDPAYKDINDLEDLSLSMKDKVQFFFENYKRLEPEKWVNVKHFINSEEALELYEKAVERYSECKNL